MSSKVVKSKGGPSPAKKALTLGAGVKTIAPIKKGYTMTFGTSNETKEDRSIKRRQDSEANKPKGRSLSGNGNPVKQVKQLASNKMAAGGPTGKAARKSDASYGYSRKENGPITKTSSSAAARVGGPRGTTAKIAKKASMKKGGSSKMC